MSRFVVYGGNGHRRLREFETNEEAYQFATKFEAECWSMGVMVPRSQIREES